MLASRGAAEEPTVNTSLLFRCVRVPRVLHIAYDNSLMLTREGVIRRGGYDVRSVLGNTSAMELLATDKAFDFVGLCQAANYSERSRMVLWLKTWLPLLPIVSLHWVYDEPVKGADVTLPAEHPAELLGVLHDRFPSTQTPPPPLS